MMLNPHDLALSVLTASSAAAALLVADAADEALRMVPIVRRRRAALAVPVTRVPVWVRPMALHCTSLVFLGGMATAGAFLVSAFP